MARLNSGLRLVRAIFLLLALAGALIGAFAEAGQQAKRARTPKSADANPTDLDEARAAYTAALSTTMLEPERRFLAARIASIQGICETPPVSG